MMRPIIFQVPPADAVEPGRERLINGQVNLAFTDNSANETGFVIQKSTDPNFVNPAASTISVAPSRNTNPAGEGTDWGSTISATDATRHRERITTGFRPWTTVGQAVCPKPIPSPFSDLLRHAVFHRHRALQLL